MFINCVKVNVWNLALHKIYKESIKFNVIVNLSLPECVFLHIKCINYQLLNSSPLADAGTLEKKGERRIWTYLHAAVAVSVCVHDSNLLTTHLQARFYATWPSTAGIMFLREQCLIPHEGTFSHLHRQVSPPTILIRRMTHIKLSIKQSKSCRQHGFQELCPCSPYGMHLSAYHR